MTCIYIPQKFSFIQCDADNTCGDVDSVDVSTVKQRTSEVVESNRTTNN